MKKLSIPIAAPFFAAIALAASPAAAAYIYTPTAGYETAEGNGNNGVFIQNQASRQQWRYDAQIFGADPFLINGFSFRFEKTWGDVSGVFDLSAAFHVQVATLQGAFSTTFAENLQGAKTVMAGARKLPFSTGAPAGQTKPFGVHFVFDAPYLYDPSAGDLIVDMFIPAQGQFGTLDFVKDHSLQNRLYKHGDPTAAKVSSASAYGPVTRFDITPIAVPEPAAWSLMILGFGGAGAALRRSRACARAW